MTTVDAAVLEKLARYQGLLAEWGSKINLTALRDPVDIAVRHFLDSLALVARLPSGPALAAAGLPPTLVDVGSGAGFPGAVCALFRPDLQITLVERIGKKAAFLQALRRELGLRYDVETTSAERLLRAGVGPFSLAVARAALPLPEWLALGASLVHPGGTVFAMTTDEPPPRLAGLALTADETYDVGAGPHRILTYVRTVA